MKPPNRHIDRDSNSTSALWTNLYNLLGIGYKSFKDSVGFTHDCCTLIRALELAYKTSIHAPKGKTPEKLEKALNPEIPADTLKKDLVDIHPTESSFKLLIDKVRHHSNQSINDSFEYAKQK
ncbi:hypothetical protein O181_051524 [Austropuccinia psidii MF-1]|uniref:Uncharacterized protein n=1 Tax=Austropuccinia psidii MF-1 TaxID=1389203 RepID=A0A9Q3HQT0_9BASI|nr:hypothetical protein [Austropuccinia psidii MF-1]